jgi:uncharacterized membrane protein YfcA
MFTAEAIAIGIAAAIVIGLSKTALPAAGLLSVPLVATIVDGRLITGATLPLLIAADVFAVSWYRQHARWDLLRPLVPWLGVGYAAGIVFYVVVGNSARPIEIVIGSIVLLMVAIQTWRMLRRASPRPTTLARTATYGSAGGFTTFVSNSAGPVINTYLIGLGLDKREQVGTSAWLYFVLNLTKVPLYLTLGLLTGGGHFFTGESLLWDVCVAPAIVVGAYLGRWIFPHIADRTFVLLVLALSALGGLKLLVI